jgi:hypothetical protein
MAKAKKKVGPSISAMAKIEKITAGRKGDAIKFDELMFEPKDNALLTTMLRKGAPVLLTILMDGDTPIQSPGTLTKSEINVTNQNPKFSGVSFSPDQHAELVRLMRSDAEVTVTIEQSQGELPFDGESTE